MTGGDGARYRPAPWLAILVLAALPACGTSGRGPGGGDGETAAPAAAPALAEAAVPGSPLVLRVRSITRPGPEVLEVTFALAAPGPVAPGSTASAAPASASLEDWVAAAYLAGEEGQKRFYVLRGASGGPRCVPAPPGAAAPCRVVAARFPAPDTGPGTLTVVIPGFAPFRKVPYPGTAASGPS